MMIENIQEFMSGFANETGLGYAEADLQWAGFSRQLSDSDRQGIEAMGYESGKREGANFNAMYPENPQTNSIGIRNWSEGQELTEVFFIGLGDSRLIGWKRHDGARAIETNGDPIFEGGEDFETMWESYA